MRAGNARVWIRHCPREELHGHITTVTQLVNDRESNILDWQICAPLELIHEASRIARSRHARRLSFHVVRMILVQRRIETLRVDKLDVEDFGNVYRVYKAGQ